MELWKKILLISIAGFSSQILASNTSPLSLAASIGYQNYANMIDSEGQSPVERLAIDCDFLNHDRFALGLEMGVQNGDTMHVSTSYNNLQTISQGIPIETTVKPVIDLLATIKKNLGASLFFLQTKVGVAYRAWQFNNVSNMNNLYQFAPEVQAGFGYQFSPRMSLSFLYQGIFGGSPDITSTGDPNDVNSTTYGYASHIPNLNAGLLTLSINV